ncbi:hypothetical protein EIP86_010292 [Pleurotus ostreatoroseus]|nr:hypothetical protein EIP86_010292 [Pleurotus ostreatoroseus]
MLWIVWRRRGRLRLRPSMSARCGDSVMKTHSVCLMFNFLQLTAIKLRQKAIADTAGSFESLTQLGY